MEYVDVVKEFLSAERTSNWYLHLQAVQKMMNLFAATGHVNYARSSRNVARNVESGRNQSLAQRTVSRRSSCSPSSRTALLWLHYMEYVDVVKEFLSAERTSNWYLHLQAVQKMMNLFAATGHVNYARSSRNVQEMLSLAETNPWLSEQFQEGRHAVRRSGRYWAGLWSDLVIEQTLMRSLKIRGGLTRGHGFEENVRHLWVSSINYTAAVHEAVTSLSGIKVETSEQHLAILVSASPLQTCTL